MDKLHEVVQWRSKDASQAEVCDAKREGEGRKTGKSEENATAETVQHERLFDNEWHFKWAKG